MRHPTTAVRAAAVMIQAIVATATGLLVVTAIGKFLFGWFEPPAPDCSDVQPGLTHTYTVTVTNAGDAPADGVGLMDVIPACYGFVTASDGGIYDPDTRKITWPPTTMGPGTQVNRTATVVGDPTDGRR